MSVFGIVANDPELSYTPSGVAVCHFRVAVNQQRSGDETTTWVKVTCWRRLAESVAEHMKKGEAVFVSGNDVQVSSFQTRAGEPGASLELTASDVRFLGKRAPVDEADPVGMIPF